MTSKQLRSAFLDFMASKGHVILPSSSLVPKEDPTVLFTTAGMHPLVPYLMGLAQHPSGKRLANSQKCLRTGDIEEVGDNRHLTFFEMLGNWSIGDYFKAESISWSFEFLTSSKWLGLDPNRIFVTVYKGSSEAAADEESIDIWTKEFEKVGIIPSIGDEFDFKHPEKNSSDAKYIYKITKRSGKDNWWGLPHRGPCGACTEIYYLLDEHALDFQESVLPKLSAAQADEFIDSQVVEIWNNVFMEYEGEWKTGESEPTNLVPLKNKCVDTGMGFERILAFMNKYENVFEADILSGLIEVAEKYRA